MQATKKWVASNAILVARHTFAFTVRVDRAHTRDATNRSFRTCPTPPLPCGGRRIHQHPTPTPLLVSKRAQSTALHFYTTTTTQDCANASPSPAAAKKPSRSGSDGNVRMGCRYVFSNDVQSESVLTLSDTHSWYMNTPGLHNDFATLPNPPPVRLALCNRQDSRLNDNPDVA